MKNILPILFAFVFILTEISSCRKEIPFEEEEPTDTLFPKPYLPIYPGSWWTYRYVADSTTFTEVAGEYVIDAMIYDHHHSKKYYVPTWRGHNYFGYGYNERHNDIFAPMLDFQLDTSWLVYQQGGDCIHGGCFTVTRKVLDTSVTCVIDSVTYTNVIRVLESHIGSGYASSYSTVFDFAKDVGLIQKLNPAYDSAMNFIPVPIYQLVDYDINN